MLEYGMETGFIQIELPNKEQAEDVIALLLQKSLIACRRCCEIVYGHKDNVLLNVQTQSVLRKDCEKVLYANTKRI